MRDSVTIDGVTLTRQQIEEAQKKLDAPEYRCGDVVVSSHGTAMLVVDREDSYLSRRARDMDEEFAAVANEHGSIDGYSKSCLERVGTLSEIVAFYRQHHPEAK